MNKNPIALAQLIVEPSVLIVYVGKLGKKVSLMVAIIYNILSVVFLFDEKSRQSIKKC